MLATGCKAAMVALIPKRHAVAGYSEVLLCDLAHSRE